MRDHPVRSGQLMLLMLITWLTPLLRSHAQETTVRIGSWNIEWLGSPEKRGVDRGVARKAEDIANYVQSSGVVVLGLNEITFDQGEAGKRQNKLLTEAFELIEKQTGQEWKYLLFPKRDAEDAVLHAGVAWNASKVALVGEPYLIPVRRNDKLARIWDRAPQAIKFSLGEGKTDVVVIPVHMKSNSGGFQRTFVQRADEAKALIRSLGAIQNRFKDDDVVILGDFNTLFGDESAIRCYKAGGFVDLNWRSENTWIKSDRYDYAPFDRVLIPEDQDEFAASKFTVHKGHSFASEKEFRKRLSDHYLIYADVKVMKDDD